MIVKGRFPATGRRARLIVVAIAAAALTGQMATAATGDIATVAGGGPGVPVIGDGGPATGGSLPAPAAVAVDSSGTVFIADTAHHRIRKVSTSGTITTVAGTGASGFSGDGGPAASATLSYPSGVAVGPAGSLYIADSSNLRVRKVSGSGTISTVAGNGSIRISGDGGPATNAGIAAPVGLALDAAGNLFISGYHVVRKVSTSGTITTFAGEWRSGNAGSSGDGGPAVQASLYNPRGLAVDAFGNLFIADSGNSRIRKVNSAGVISTVAGGGTIAFGWPRPDPVGGLLGNGPGDGGPATDATLKYPLGVATDSSGNLYIADTANQRVRRVNAAGTISTLAGNGRTDFSGDGGPATSASLNYPSAIAASSSGSVLIADIRNYRIRMVAPSGMITTVAGNGTQGVLGDGGPATGARLDTPAGVATDSSGNLYIADTANNRIRKVSSSGTITTVAGNGTPSGYPGTGGPATSASIDRPYGLATDSSGNLFIADTYSHRIRKVSASGTITTVAGNGADGFSGDGGPATMASLNYPVGVATDSSGNLFIADTYNHRIRKVDATGTITTVAGRSVGDQVSTPRYVCVGSYPLEVCVPNRDGNVCLPRLDCVSVPVFTADVPIGDGGPAVAAKLFYPTSVAIDDPGNIFIADRLHSRVRKVDALGTITTVAGNGAYGFAGDGGPATGAKMSLPWGIAIDATGNLFVSDDGNSRIRKIDVAGIITTVAGSGISGFAGDGGPATQASLRYPTSIAFDAGGNLVIADTYNHRIRLVSGH